MSTFGTTDIRTEHSSTRTSDFLLSSAAAIIGAGLAFNRFLPATVSSFNATFLVAVFFGVLGYWVGITHPLLRRAFVWIAGFSFFAVVTTLAAGQPQSFGGSIGILIWLLLIPGFASLLLEARRWRAMLYGLLFGASVLMFVVLWRFARGVRLLDAGSGVQFFSIHRYLVDISVVWLIPIVWSKSLRIPQLGRWLFTATAVLWLSRNGGRTGLISLLLLPVAYLALKPAPSNQRALRLIAMAVLGALLYVGVTSVSLPGIPATQRIAESQSSDRTESDDIRSLLNEKSLALAQKNPVFGVGFGLYNGQYDPVVEKSRNSRIRRQVIELPGHNSYYEVLAMMGYPGGILYVGMLLVPLAAGIRHAHDPDVRALTAGYVTILFTIAFHTSWGSVIALPSALVLAAAARAGPRPLPSGFADT